MEENKGWQIELLRSLSESGMKGSSIVSESESTFRVVGIREKIEKGSESFKDTWFVSQELPLTTCSNIRKLKVFFGL